MAELLIDTMTFSCALQESADSSKPHKLVMKGEFARSDKPTENKRLYREHLWRREIGRLSEAMRDRRAFGELDHPADGRTKLQRVSHLLTNLRVEGNSVIGEAELLDTPMGRIMKTLAEAGAKVGVSSRGFGSTKALPNGIMEVQEDFRLDTFDFVADPATKTAYPKVFQEEIEKVPGDGDFTLESFKRDYPGLADEFAAAALREGCGCPLADGDGEPIREDVESPERALIEEEVREQLSNELLRKIEKLDEAAETRVRQELLNDPEVGGAIQVLEQIAGLVTSFASSTPTGDGADDQSGKVSELEKRVSDKELEVEAAEKKYAEMAEVAKEATYRLHMERKLSGDPSRDTIVKLVGDVKSFKNVSEIDERIEAIQGELSSAKTEDDEPDDIEAKLRERIANLEGKLSKATEEADHAKSKLKEAIQIAETIQIESYLRGVQTAHPQGEEVVDLCEGITDIDGAERVIRSFGARRTRALDQDEAERIRSRVSRGNRRALSEEENPFRDGTSEPWRDKNGEGQSGALVEGFGLTDDAFDELSGIPENQR